VSQPKPIWRSIQKALGKLRTDRHGQDILEYAFLMAIMVIAIVVVLPNDLMPTISKVFSRVLNVASQLTNH
jgi:hypothetical protein